MTELTLYVLVDPRDEAVRYVGATHKSLRRRLLDHMQSIGRVQNTAPRFVWLRELRTLGLTPEIRAVDTTDEDNWSDAEQSWIDYYRGMGCDLLNVMPGGGGPRVGVARNRWTPEQRERHSLQARSRLNEDPALRTRIAEGTRAGMANMLAARGEGFRQRVADAVRRRYEDPAERERTGDLSRQQWAKPGVKEARSLRMREAADAEARVACPVCGMTSRQSNITRHRRVRGH